MPQSCRARWIRLAGSYRCTRRSGRPSPWRGQADAPRRRDVGCLVARNDAPGGPGVGYLDLGRAEAPCTGNLGRLRVRHIERRLIQFAHALARLLLHGHPILAFHPEVRVMVQEVAEDLLAIAGVLHGVEDVVVPEGVDVLERRHFHGRERFHQVKGKRRYSVSAAFARSCDQLFAQKKTRRGKTGRAPEEGGRWLARPAPSHRTM